MNRRCLFALALAFLAMKPASALAHCDTLDGPVVKDARAALEAKDVTAALKWVGEDREGDVRQAFQQALVVRVLGPEAQALADRSFFETLVRLHREGEGAPFTGLKPSGSAVDPGIAASDAALESGSAEALVSLVTRKVEDGLRERHARAVAGRREASESIAKGRAYVARYVELLHYAEGLLAAASPSRHPHADGLEHTH
jgi:hypothetical protein